MQKSFCVTALIFAMVVPSKAAVIVSGDFTPAFYITPPLATVGNQQFFKNILGSNDRVLVLRSHGSSINEFYNGLPGVFSTSVVGLDDVVLFGALKEYDLLVCAVPDEGFTPEVVSGIANFLDANGTLFLMGKPALSGQSSKVINNLLFDLGIPIALNSDSYDIGPQTSTLSEIANHPLTAGITSFNYGSAFSITGGVPLFLTHNGLPYVVVVPEPSTFALLAIGAIGLCIARRRLIAEILNNFHPTR